MKKTMAALSLAALMMTPRMVRAQDPAPGFEAPPSGTGMLVTGAIFTGIGGINLLTSPICVTPVIQSSTKTICLGLSLGVGITFAVIGVPLLVVGAGRRSRYVEWKKSHGALGKLTDLGFAPTPGGALLTWQTQL